MRGASRLLLGRWRSRSSPNIGIRSPYRQILLIVNPVSRRGTKLVASAERAFAAAGVTCETVVTTHAGHAAEIVRASTGYDAIFTLGGDGTAVEVIAAAGPSGLPVGILPGGTGNLLVRALGVPLTIRRAVQTLLAGDLARIDLGQLADGRRFAIGVGIGIDASMIAETAAHWKRRIGVAAYVVAAARVILRQDRFVVRITVDGHTTERRASIVLVANFGTLLHGLVTLGDGIRYDDGRLDVCLFDLRSLPDALRVFRKLVLRDFRPDPAMAYWTGTRIIVETNFPRPAQADGDIIAYTPLTVSVAPLAGCLIVPHRQINRQ